MAKPLAPSAAPKTLYMSAAVGSRSTEPSGQPNSARTTCRRRLTNYLLANLCSTHTLDAPRSVCAANAYMVHRPILTYMSTRVEMTLLWAHSLYCKAHLLELGRRASIHGVMARVVWPGSNLIDDHGPISHQKHLDSATQCQPGDTLHAKPNVSCMPITAAEGNTCAQLDLRTAPCGGCHLMSITLIGH